MDETITNEVETVENDEISEVDAAFDEVWDDTVPEDDDFDLTDDEADDSADAQPQDDEAADETSAEPESSDDSAEAGEEKPAEEKTEDQGNQLFTLKFLGQDKTVTRDEMIELAQKGANYDHILNERNALKENQTKYKGYEAFLHELAEGSGMDIDSLMENTRARMLINEANARGEELSEEDAVAQVRQRMKEQEASAAKADEAEKAPAQAPQEETQEEKQRKAFTLFLAEYPDVDPKDIPHEVWAEFGETMDLVGSYRKHEIKQLRKENETLKQNQKNKERSTGSRRTAGATTPKDAFDEAWDSEF